MTPASFPDPQPGLVIRYAYLWRTEADSGGQEGIKDRPCAVVLAVRKDGGETRVVVAPITHSAPDDPRSGIEIPAATKVRLGLDEKRSWIIVDEVNVFNWPGPDLRPVDAGSSARRFYYGFLPQALARSVIDGVGACLRGGKAKPVGRD